MIQKILILFLAAIAFSTPLLSADSSSKKITGQYQVIDNSASKISNYKVAKKRILKAQKLEKKGKNKKAQELYSEAYSRLIRANKKYPLYPDILNYLGFTTGKLGNLADAEIYYLLGLDIDPNHKGLNEHLGVLYIEMKKIDKAKERLIVLENCKCEEFRKLQNLISKY